MHWKFIQCLYSIVRRRPERGARYSACPIATKSDPDFFLFSLAASAENKMASCRHDDSGLTAESGTKHLTFLTRSYPYFVSSWFYERLSWVDPMWSEMHLVNWEHRWVPFSILAGRLLQVTIWQCGFRDRSEVCLFKSLQTSLELYE